MATNRIGRQSFRPGSPVFISNWASVVGKKEREGPLGHLFDLTSTDTKFGEKSWEQAEQRMQQLALETLLDKEKLQHGDVDLVFSGDLLNQCIGSSFTLRNTGLPHLGLYGACSTMAESLLLSAMTVGGGYADRVVAMTSSHFASSERQYRFPLGYGGQRTPTAQWTVTGSGAALVTSRACPIEITAATVGTVEDLGITDANNMGAAMAPAGVKLGPCPRTFMAAIFSYTLYSLEPELSVSIVPGFKQDSGSCPQKSGVLPVQESTPHLRSAFFRSNHQNEPPPLLRADPPEDPEELLDSFFVRVTFRYRNRS